MMPDRTYFDHNATTPLRQEARDALIAALGSTGNASSVHGEGRRARGMIEDARIQVANRDGHGLSWRTISIRPARTEHSLIEGSLSQKDQPGMK